ncbi:DNA repair protein RecO [candidate division KSB1 bacterium]|nr:DNA repair protein RecO [candidate division KSB1 bacterium]
MSITKADAIIMHSRKQGETSKILRLYTREFGKISAMAKGSRGTRSKYLGALEPFNRVSLVFYKKEGRQLHYLSDASITESFGNLHAQLGKLALAAVACEIIDKSEQDDHSHPEQFLLLLNTLRALDQHKTGLRNIIRAFQIQFITMAGFEPELEACHYCHRPEVDTLLYFSPNLGLYSCSQCGHLKETGKPVSGFVIELLRWFKGGTVANAAAAKVSKSVGEEIDTLLLEYLQTHIDSLLNLKSVSYMKKLEIDLLQYKSNEKAG